MSRVAMCFHGQVRYRALSLHYACIQSLGIIRIPKIVSVTASNAELAHGEKSHTQSLTQFICTYSINQSLSQLI